MLLICASQRSTNLGQTIVQIVMTSRAMTSPLRRLVHWGPVASMAITAALTFTTLSTKANLIWILSFQLTMCITLYNMWCATLIGPGYMSSAEEESSSTSNGVKSTKGLNRFCRRCCRIVLRKHHHCPWINNCVGQNNEQYFLRFLYSTIAVSLQSSILLIIDTCQRNSSASILFNVVSISLSIGVFISMLMLLYTH